MNGDLEQLPYDAFAHLVSVGGIENEDLLRLCNTSRKINSYCNKNDQAVIKQALKRTYGIDYESVRHLRHSPREFLKFFKFNIYYKVKFLDNYKLTRDDFIRFLIPDVVIEAMAKSLNTPEYPVTVERLMKSSLFVKIINQHRSVSLRDNNPNILDIRADRLIYNENHVAVSWVPGKSVTEKNIPIIWMSKPIKDNKITIPPYEEPEPGGHGNFTVDYNGNIVQIKDKLGRTLHHVDRHTRRYPTRQAAEAESRRRQQYRQEIEVLKADNKDLIDAVILGVIMLPGQFDALRRELQSVQFAIVIHEDCTYDRPVRQNSYGNLAGNFRPDVGYEINERDKVVAFDVHDPKPKEKGFLFGKVESNLYYKTLTFYRTKEALINDKLTGDGYYGSFETPELLEFVNSGKTCYRRYEGATDVFYFIPIQLP